MRSLFLVFIFISSVFAHKVNLFITTKGDIISIYSYFANGKACKNCNLIIKNQEKIILEDKLDINGKYDYIPKYKNIEVIIDASGGHIAKEKVVVQNLKHKDIKEYKEKEKFQEYKKIVLGLFILFIFFFLLKKFKK